MAEVHLARDGEGGAWVALKRIRSDLRGDPELRERLEREAQICASLSHPNIVSLLAWGVDVEGPYLALEYVFGRPASALVKESTSRGEFLPLEVTLCIARESASALRYAHSVVNEAMGVRGVIHRDISPDNILVSYDGTAKLTDFGIARMVGATTRLTQVQSVKGKFGYLAPELFDGHPGDVQTDAFAFGVTLYTLLCGVAPFRGHTEAELMRSVFTQQPVPPSAVRPGIAPSLDALILRCVSQRREERPSSFAEILAGLGGEEGDPWRGGRAAVSDALARLFPVAADPRGAATGSELRRSTRTVHPAPRTGRRRGLLAAGAAALSLLLAVGVALPALTDSALPTPTPDAGPSPGVALTEPRTEPSTATKPAERAPPPARRAGTTRTSAGPEPGTLLVRIRPWAQVFVDGELRGISPLPAMTLAPGAHSVILINPQRNYRRHYTVEIRPGMQTRLNASIDEP
jgi:serine/threonine-protein kinase